MIDRLKLLSSYKHAIKQFVRSNKRAKIHQFHDDNTKNIAILNYNKISLVKQQAIVTDPMQKLNIVTKLNELNRKIDELKNIHINKSKDLLFYINSSSLKNSLLNNLSETNSNMRLVHLNDISLFLQNQMEYEELIERYNPGLTMSQSEKVKRTASKVGLQIPDSK